MDFDSLVAGKNLILCGAVFVLTTTFRKAFTPFFEAGVGERLLPFMPLILGILGAVLGVCENANTIYDKICIGAIAGFAVGHGFKLGKTSVLGYGVTKRPKKKTVAVLVSEPGAVAPKPEDGPAAKTTDAAAVEIPVVDATEPPKE